MQLLDRDQLETFATIAAEGSFERAATILSISRGAVSQRIKALEASLATVLLVRDRPVVPTSAGEILLRHVNAMRINELITIQSLRPCSADAPVSLAVAVNPDSLATWFPKVLWRLLRRGRIAIEIVTDDQTHTLSHLTRGEVTGCVSTESKAAAGFVSHRLGTMEYRCYATPAFAAQYFPQGLSVPAALCAPAIVFNRTDRLHDAFLHALFGFPIDHYSRNYVPASELLLQGLREGIGYGLLPVMQVQAQGEAVGLIDLAPRHPVTVDLYWHHWEHESPLSAEITSQVISEAAERLSATCSPVSAVSSLRRDTWDEAQSQH